MLLYYLHVILYRGDDPKVTPVHPSWSRIVVFPTPSCIIEDSYLGAEFGAQA